MSYIQVNLDINQALHNFYHLLTLLHSLLVVMSLTASIRLIDCPRHQYVFWIYNFVQPARKHEVHGYCEEHRALWALLSLVFVSRQYCLPVLGCTEPYALQRTRDVKEGSTSPLGEQIST